MATNAPRYGSRTNSPGVALLQLAVASVCLLGSYPVKALDPDKPPGQNFDLSHWKLTLPVDSSGGTNGNAAEIPAAQLVAGYTNASYFYTGPDGAMIFWCPVTGATTSGSSYPRSELRELLNPATAGSNWMAWGTHTLAAQCKVTQMPSSRKVIIGQIHGYTGNAYPVIKLQFNNGTIEALVKHSPNSDADTKYTFMNVGLSNLVSYQIRMVDGLLSLTVNGSTQSVNLFQTDPAWAQQTMYYKAGSYCQDNAGATNEGALVSFHALGVTHAPSITNHPASQSVAAGQSAAFSVSANGNGPLSYRWRLNSTNLAGATSRALSVTNAQSTSAGSYSVVVSDSLGSTTSVIATLTVNPPMRFTNCSRDASGNFNALLLGSANSNYVVQASTDLTNWTSVLTNASPSGMIWFTDPDTASFSNRFYRALDPG